MLNAVFIAHIRTIHITLSFKYLLLIATEHTGEQNCRMGVKVLLNILQKTVCI